jgi:hypothetical protein
MILFVPENALIKHDSFVLSILWQQVKDSLYYIFFLFFERYIVFY